MPGPGLCLSVDVMKAETVDEAVVLRVYVSNQSDDDVRVNRRFAVGRPGTAAEVSLAITGPDGEQRPFTTRIRLGQADEEEDYVWLVPYAGVGRDLVIEPGTYVDLTQPGRYTVVLHWSPGELSSAPFVVDLAPSLSGPAPD